jgi:hypothetical protein
MSNWFEPTDEQRRAHVAWVSQRPARVRDLIQKYGFEPWKLYRLKSSNQRVTIYSYQEPKDGSPVTLKVNVSGEFNLVAFERTVFGIPPDDLEECDLPPPGTPVGSADLSIEESHTLFEAFDPSTVAAQLAALKKR